MHKTAIILHGKPDHDEYYDPAAPSASNAHWLPWLQKQLLVHGITAQTPEVPQAWNPDYAAWCREFERYDITAETMLVGHSCGGGFLVRWLSEHPHVRVKLAILVAPWLDPEGRDTTDFFHFTIDPQLTKRLGSLTIFNSDDDAADIHTSVNLIRTALPAARYREFHRYGHFCFNDLKTDQFPELLTELLTAEA